MKEGRFNVDIILSSFLMCLGGEPFLLVSFALFNLSKVGNINLLAFTEILVKMRPGIKGLG